MVSANVIFMILGLVALLDSLVVLLFPNWAMKTMKSWMKSNKSLRRVGTIELIIALIIILIGMNI